MTRLTNNIVPLISITFIILILTVTIGSKTAAAENFADIIENNLKKTFDAAGIAQGENVHLEDIAVNIINIALGIFGIVFTGLLIYGGWLYMTASGNQDRVEQGVKTIRWAIIGILIVITSYAISIFVAQNIVESTGGVLEFNN